MKSYSELRFIQTAWNFSKMINAINHICTRWTWAIVIDRIRVDIDWSKGRICMVCIDGVKSTVWVARKKKCVESIKNSIRNRMCARIHAYTHTVASSCVTLFLAARLCLQIFLPWRSRENRVITAIPPRLLYHLQPPKQRGLAIKNPSPCFFLYLYHVIPDHRSFPLSRTCAFIPY